MIDRKNEQDPTASRLSEATGPEISNTSSSACSWVRWLPALLLPAAVVAFSVDCPLARWCLSGHCPGAIKKAFDLSEVFGHGYGTVLIAAMIFQLDPSRRWALPRLLTSSLGAGLLANAVKVCLVRVRPHDFSFTGTVWDTFGAWFPLGAGGSGHQSFPSGHTAVAVGLAMSLAWLYPRGRWVFAVLAVFVACQRVVAAGHYLSDVLFAAALGGLWSTACVYCGPLARRFDRWELHRRNLA
ncbi:MAG: phosphatase PAP2 family protein [Pirellulaceae bacterium]